MKKFMFPLDTVLGYKERILDSKQGEHGRAIHAVREQEEVIEKLMKEFNECNAKFRERSIHGLTAIEAIGFESYMKFLNERIKKEKDRLDELKMVEESCRAEVVEAKMETSTIEKLKEKKKMEYHKQEQKSQELFIEEFVSNKMTSH